MLIEKINATLIERGCCVYFFNLQKMHGVAFSSITKDSSRISDDIFLMTNIYIIVVRKIF